MLNRDALIKHYTQQLGWGLVTYPTKTKRPDKNGWPDQPITRPDDIPQKVNIGLNHGYSKTATLDIDHPAARAALAAVGIDLDEILQACVYKILGDPDNPAKPVFRLPARSGLKTRQLRWPDESGKLNSNGTPAQVIIFELRGGPGFQDVLPPSIHPDKHTYTWLNDNVPSRPDDIPTIPDSLLFLWENWDALEPRLKAACPWAQPAKAESRHNGKVSHDSEFDVTLIQRTFNERYTAINIIERNGYRKQGNKWLCPNSASGNPGIIFMRDGDKVKSYHGSDPLSDGNPHDAYDCYVILEHGGNRSEAWRAAKNELGITFSSNGDHSEPKSEPVIDQETGEVQEPTETESEMLPTYTTENGQIIYHAPVRAKGVIVDYNSVTVADFTAAITQEITAEDGTRYFGVDGQTRFGQPFSFEISTEDFASDNQLKATLIQYAGAKAPVMANMSKHLAPAIQRFTNGTLKQVKRYGRTGWTDEGRFLLPGREPEGIAIHLPRKLPYGVTSEADLKKGLEAFGYLLLAAPAEKITVALSFVLTPPLAAAAGWRESDRYALFVSGQTGTLKTTEMQLCMALYGPGFLRDDSLIRFGDGATKLSMQKFATCAHDLPLLIDNYKPGVSPGEAGFYALLHAMVEGGEKDRLNRASELRDSAPIYTWPIFTGEDTPDKDPASLARILKIDWTGGDTDKLTTAQSFGKHLCAVGSAWIAWLESDSGRQAASAAGAKFTQLRGKWTGILLANNSNTQNAMRVASNLAINELTWQVMCHLDSPIGLYARSNDLPLSQQVGLREVAKGMANETAASLEATRFLAALQEVIRVGDKPPTGFKELYTSNSVLIGWQDTNDQFYIKPTQARKAVDDLLGKPGLGEVSMNKIYSQLEGLDLIAEKGTDGRTTRQKKINGENGRVLHLKREAFEWGD